jgi:hypothetical protein
MLMPDAVPPLGGEGFESLDEILLVRCAVATAFAYLLRQGLKWKK